MTFLAFLGLGAPEWGVILLIFVLFFGAAKIPELARSFGKAKGEFEKGVHDGARESTRTVEDEEAARVRAAAKALGIEIEGRSLADIKADLRAATD